MRIGVWHDLPTGGGRRAFENHCAGLVGLGHELIVVYPKRPEASPTLPLSTTSIAVGLKRHRWGSPGANLPPAAGTYDRIRNLDRHLEQAAEQLNDAKVDVAFVNTSRDVRCPDLAGRLEAPALIYLQEPYRWLYEALPELPWIRAGRPRLRESLNRQAWRHMMDREVSAARAYARILVNSLFSRESVLRAYGLESSVCRLGIDTEVFRPGSEGRRNHVITVGAMMPEKRQLECVAAVGAVPKDLRPALICISNVASGPYAREVAEAAKRLDVQLLMKTAVTDSALLGWLQTAKALLYAPRLEPFGLAPIEAGATATPVVGVAEGGVRETVLHGETGLLVERTEALGSALTLVLEDRELAQRLGARGREIATSVWSNDQASVRLEAELLQLAESHR